MNKPSRAERLRYAFDNFMARGTIALILGLFVGRGDRRDHRHDRRRRSSSATTAPHLRPAVEQPDADARPGHDGRRHGLVRVPARDAGGHPVRDLHHQRAHRHHQHRARGQARRAAQGPVARGRVGPHRHPRLVAGDLHGRLGARDGQREPAEDAPSSSWPTATRATWTTTSGRACRTTGKTSVICRTGVPMDIDDLEIARLETSRAIVILSPETDDPDADVIKTMLAVTNHPRRRPEPYHIVAELHDPANLDVARLVGGDRGAAHPRRRPDLADHRPDLPPGRPVDRLHRAARLRRRRDLLRDAARARRADVRGRPARLRGLDAHRAPAGRRRPEAEPADGHAHRRPATRSSSSARTTTRSGSRATRAAVDEARHPDRRAGPGRAGTDPRPRLEPAGADDHPRARRVRRGRARRSSSSADIADGGPRARGAAGRPSPTSRSGSSTPTRPAGAVLDRLDVPSFDHIVVLCYSDALDTQRADSRTIITLLHLRDMEERSGLDFSIVSEMLDLRNRALAEVTHADDFIVSARLVSLLMAQVAENAAPQRGLRRPVRPGGLGDLPAHGPPTTSRPASR